MRRSFKGRDVALQRPRWRTIILGLTLGALLICLAATARWFIWPSQDNPTSADAVVVLAGGVDGDRIDRALELMEDGVAPVLVVSTGDEEWERSTRIDRLCTVGSPDFAVICLTPEPDSTIGEAMAFGEVARQRGYDDLVIVSSDWHLHRAQLWMDRCFDGTTSVVGADTPSSPDIVSHEAAGTLHALVFNRSCPDVTDDRVIAEFDQWEPDPSAEATPTQDPADGDALLERRDRDPSRTECQDWIGRRWMMTVYSVPVDNPDTRTVADLATEGFTHVGPWYEDDRWTSGPEAAQLGLCTVFPVGESRSVENALADLDSTIAAIRSDLERALADAELDASISAWSLLPEELNIYKDGHRELLETMAATINELDPLQRPIYSYLQSNADERQLETASLITGVLGQGNYLSTNGRADQRIYLRASIDRALAARADMNQMGDAVLPVIEHRIHSGILDPALSPLIETWVRHDIFTTVVTGADGFISFSGFPPRQGLDDFARYNDAYTTVVAEVIEAGVPDLYRYGIVDTSITATVVAGPAELEVPVLFVPQRDNPTETFSSVSVRGWSGADGRTVIVVNHSNDPITVEVQGADFTVERIELEPLGVEVLQY